MSVGTSALTWVLGSNFGRMTFEARTGPGRSVRGYQVTGSRSRERHRRGTVVLYELEHRQGLDPSLSLASEAFGGSRISCSTPALMRRLISLAASAASAGWAAHLGGDECEVATLLPGARAAQAGIVAASSLNTDTACTSRCACSRIESAAAAASSTSAALRWVV